MYPDFHIHTGFSDDSTEKPENTIESAVRMGMPAVCITDHLDMNTPDGSFAFDQDVYFKELTLLKEKYADRIEVCIGVELGFGLENSASADPSLYLQGRPYEHVIGSMHYVERADPYLREQVPLSDEEMYRQYFEDLLCMIRDSDAFQTVGHLDYIARYGYDGGKGCTYAAYRELLDAILEEIIRRGLILEINTAGFRKPSARPNPSAEILEIYRKMGGDRVILGSDAHDAAGVGGFFDRAGEMLRQIGFTHLTLPGRKGEREIPL
ncbi:MAG: histidinol-phosphatase HisJ family protein [Eubacterium sp.]|nr:histidinol-phosphatase HisJ family protein [Eubacterium sp.]